MIQIKKFPAVDWRDIRDEYLAACNKSFNIYEYLDDIYKYNKVHYAYIPFDMTLFDEDEGYEIDRDAVMHNDLVIFLREHLPPEYKDADEILIYCT